MATTTPTRPVRIAHKSGFISQHTSDLRGMIYTPTITIKGVRYFGPKQTSSEDAARFARLWAEGRLSVV